MNFFLDFYQHLPGKISPVIFSIGPIVLHWYALAYLAAFTTIFSLSTYRIKKGETVFPAELVSDFLFYVFGGVLIGARIGYVVFYNLAYYLDNPVAIVSPFGEAGKLVGIYGMSFHGGVIGALLVGWLFAKRKNIDFSKIADLIVPAIPAGFFFGRLGNFMNGELFGRATNVPWGMYFPLGGGGQLRHPSQLYEALLEGLLLFLVLWLLRNNKRLAGYFLPAYLLGYGLVRFLVEFYRQPDNQIGFIGGIFSLGQLLSVVLVIFAVILGAFQWNKKAV
jgi:phosphatidylglycerol:prolipoprotein diacylglycerol transferase